MNMSMSPNQVRCLLLNHMFYVKGETLNPSKLLIAMATATIHT